MKLLSLNPVTELDLRQRARSRSTGVVMMVWLSLAFGAAVLFAIVATSVADDGFSSMTAAEIGRGGFETLALGLAVLLIFLMPALAASSIAGERERQTLLPIQSSALGPWQIVLGKWSGAVAIVSVLVLCVSPLLAITVVVGGANAWDLMRATLGLIVMAAIIAGVAVGASGLVRSVRNAVLLSYMLTLALFAGPVVGAGVISSVSYATGGEGDAPAWLVYPEPIVLVADLAAGTERSSGPLSEISFSAREELSGEFAGFNEERLAMGIAPLWLRCLIVQGGFAVVMMFFASRRLRVPAEFER